jgi:hypothetical protein
MALLCHLPAAVLDNLQNSRCQMHLASYPHPILGDSNGAPHHWSRVHKSLLVVGEHHAAESVPAISKIGKESSIITYI